MLQKLETYLEQIGSLKPNLICDTLDFWIFIIPFSEKKSKVWQKMSSFGARIYVTTINDVLKKQLVLQSKSI